MRLIDPVHQGTWADDYFSGSVELKSWLNNEIMNWTAKSMSHLMYDTEMEWLLCDIILRKKVA